MNKNEINIKAGDLIKFNIRILLYNSPSDYNKLPVPFQTTFYDPQNIDKIIFLVLDVNKKIDKFCYQYYYCIKVLYDNQIWYFERLKNWWLNNINNKYTIISNEN